MAAVIEGFDIRSLMAAVIEGFNKRASMAAVAEGFDTRASELVELLKETSWFEAAIVKKGRKEL